MPPTSSTASRSCHHVPTTLSLDPQELSNQCDLLVRVEDANEPPSTVPRPRCAFNMTVAQEADSRADDGVDSDCVETHTGLKRRAPSSKPTACTQPSRPARQPKRKRCASPPPPHPPTSTPNAGRLPSISPRPSLSPSATERASNAPPRNVHPRSIPPAVSRGKAKHLGQRRTCPLCGAWFESTPNDVVKRHLNNTCKFSQEDRVRCITAEFSVRKGTE
ncbi:hypothetical protein FB451DRAFT_1394016 [Mycena latifolia]|nr:hypothetical protein FB451DRAFT_1394016 [Mycena latifolia]